MNRRSSFRLLILLALVLGQGYLCSGTPPEDGGPAVDIDALEGGAKVHALVEQVVEAQRAMRSLRADFKQTKKSDLLLDEVESTGHFTYLAPDHVRWDYDDPAGMVVSFADDMVTTYYPDRKRAETVKISRRNRRFVRVLAGTQPLDDLADNFSIALADPGAPRPYRLRLEPIQSVLRRRLREVFLEIDRTLLLPVVVEYHAADGDSTRYEFSNMSVNPEVEASDFVLDLGDEVEVEVVDISSE